MKILVLHSKISHPCTAETCLNDSETLRIPGTFERKSKENYLYFYVALDGITGLD